MKRIHRTHRFMTTVALATMVIMTTISAGQAADDTIAPRYALTGNFATSYSPGNDIQFMQISAAALYDYDQVWPHRAPEPLRFKIEASAGLANIAGTSGNRAVASANMLALYFIDPLTTTRVRPYVEAGIGIIYTDYQINDQGLRVNFNPQLGIGSEINLNGTPYFVAARLHHISNGGLDDDNRAINSLMLQIGQFF